MYHKTVLLACFMFAFFLKKKYFTYVMVTTKEKRAFTIHPVKKDNKIKEISYLILWLKVIDLSYKNIKIL